MIVESGLVVAVDEAAVWVETLRHSTCRSCAVQKGCGHGLLASAGAGRAHHVRALAGGFAAQEIRLGDRVDIGIPERTLVTGALIVYLVPLLALLAGAVLMNYWAVSLGWNDDPAAVIGAALGFAAGLLAVRYHGRRYRDDDTLQPVVVAVNGRDLPACGDSASTLSMATEHRDTV